MLPIVGALGVDTVFQMEQINICKVDISVVSER